MVSRMPIAMTFVVVKRSTSPQITPATSGVLASRHSSPLSDLNQCAAAVARRKAPRTMRGNSMLPIRRGRLHEVVPQKVQARAFDVLADLVRQLQRRAELLLAPQQAVEVEAHGVAVDVRV